MKLAALAGFTAGSLMVIWTFLRTHSHGESDYMAEVQWDPYVSTVTHSLLIDCE